MGGGLRPATEFFVLSRTREDHFRTVFWFSPPNTARKYDGYRGKPRWHRCCLARQQDRSSTFRLTKNVFLITEPTRTVADYGYVSLQAATLSGASLPTNAPPTVVLSASNGATFTAPAEITITATASDSDGSIRKVEFFEVGTRLGEATNAPYSTV